MPLVILLLACCTLRPDLIEVRGNPLEAATYKGRQAIHFSDAGGDQLGLIKDSSFHDGTIDVDIAAMPAKGAVEAARGFAGIAFRIKDRKTYEAFYLRPNQWTRRRPTSPQSRHAIHIRAGLAMGEIAWGNAGRLRIVCGLSARGMDARQDRRRGYAGGVLRQQRGPAMLDRQGPQGGRHHRPLGAVDWVRHRRLLRQPCDHAVRALTRAGAAA